VFSFNRGELLENCARSLLRFQLEGDRVIFDDASDDPATLRALAGLSASGIRVITTPVAEKAHHGSLYANMNRALDEAERCGCELVHFLQDDMQLLWRRRDLASHARELFGAYPDVIQLQLHFVKRLGKSRVALLPRRRAYRVLTLPGDLGVFHVARIRASGLSFEPNEAAWGNRARSLGLGVLATADPIAARVPWPRSARFGRMRGALVESAEELLLAPLDEGRIRALASRDPVRRPWGEDWIEPNGWRCWRPFPHDDSWLEWGFALTHSAIRQRSLQGLRPRRVGTRSAVARSLD
jgi:hypothetical protein